MGKEKGRKGVRKRGLFRQRGKRGRVMSGRKKEGRKDIRNKE